MESISRGKFTLKSDNHILFLSREKACCISFSFTRSKLSHLHILQALSLETLEANLTPSLTDNAMRLNLSCSVSVADGSILFLLTVKLIASRFLSLGETLTSFAYFARCINRNTFLKRVFRIFPTLRKDEVVSVLICLKTHVCL